MPDPNELPTEGLPDAVAAPAEDYKPAEIKSARYDYDGMTVMVSMIPAGADFEIPFALSPTDPYGLAPWLRVELARMVEAGEITIEPAPPVPLEDEPPA